MLDKIFDYPDPHGCYLIIAKTVVVYLFLIIGLRFLGKRELGQMNIYDLVMIVVLGNAVQNAMVNNDNTLVGGIISATVLLIMNKLFNMIIVHWKGAEKAMVGQPVLIVNHGNFLDGAMKHEGVTRDQVFAALREHGIDNIDQTESCILEVDGTISVVPKGSETYRTRKHYRALRLP
ncbi:MAG TPA: YetF domain-containing protein [Fimbriimonadaceae bacterium]|jgi:uncharacterized membrane protein YcaP (DUF421 family)